MKNEAFYPRVLIFANNGFSKTNSNGRTLAGFFNGFPKENLAQFYIQNDNPDFDICNNYYCVTDAQALKSYFSHKSFGKVIEETDFIQKCEENSKKKNKRTKKTPLSAMVREKVWNARYWKAESFDNWIDSFSPQIILVQAGDSGFMLSLAADIAKEIGIPLVIFNTENYYFKTKNYMKEAKLSSIFYGSFIRNFRKSFNKAIEYASVSIYSSKQLKELYDETFSKKSIVLYTSTSIDNKGVSKKSNFKISYLGNLGVGRHEGLVEIANALVQINPNYKLDVYGKLPNENVAKAFSSCNGISYKGFVNYDMVVEVMQSSTLLVHTENFSEFYKEDLKYAFSTKIADTMACGTCLFYYAPDTLASTIYLKENRCACVVTKKEELVESLKNIILDSEKRELYEKTASEVAKMNHDLKFNNKKFLDILRSCL